MNRDAIASAQRVVGPDAPLTLTATNNLAKSVAAARALS